MSASASSGRADIIRTVEHAKSGFGGKFSDMVQMTVFITEMA
jgi:hypothetical protein